MANPNYCDEPSDCSNGKSCNLETHGCELVDAPVPDAPVDAFAARTVQEVRSDSIPDGTPVELSNVIVTGVSLAGQFWVQQPGGGVGSGVRVFDAPVADVAQLSFGDVIDLSGGMKLHYTAGNDFSGRSTIEIARPPNGAISITKKQSNVMPMSTYLNVFGLTQMTQPEIEAELANHGGTYVQLVGVRVMSGSIVPGGLVSVGILNLWAAFSDFPPGTAVDTCFVSVKGVLDYFSNANGYDVLPQSTSDMVIGTAGYCQ